MLLVLNESIVTPTVPLCGAQQTLQCLTTMAACWNFSLQLCSAETRRCQRFLSGTPSVRYYVSNRLEMYNFKTKPDRKHHHWGSINVTECNSRSIAAELDRGLVCPTTVQMVQTFVFVSKVLCVIFLEICWLKLDRKHRCMLSNSIISSC